MSPATHQIFYDIVLSGAYAGKGMARWDDVISRADARSHPRLTWSIRRGSSISRRDGRSEAESGLKDESASLSRMGASIDSLLSPASYGQKSIWAMTSTVGWYFCMQSKTRHRLCNHTAARQGDVFGSHEEILRGCGSATRFAPCEANTGHELVRAYLVSHKVMRRDAGVGLADHFELQEEENLKIATIRSSGMTGFSTKYRAP